MPSSDLELQKMPIYTVTRIVTHSIKCESNANREYRTPEKALQRSVHSITWENTLWLYRTSLLKRLKGDSIDSSSKQLPHPCRTSVVTSMKIGSVARPSAPQTWSVFLEWKLSGPTMTWRVGAMAWTGAPKDARSCPFTSSSSYYALISGDPWGGGGGCDPGDIRGNSAGFDGFCRQWLA